MDRQLESARDDAASELLAQTVPLLTLAAIVDPGASVLLHRVQEHLAAAHG